ncbi:hypothetical protein EJC51_47435 [Streptomyces aquilus]|uniref:Uncharacterized protein n=1 Tax=Streptomyces aquilus TaxID=2548456 RepID=A0A3Q9C6M4_9ACTN|nr:hypothetical protein [Streptomyces aquilus]AZP14719.1 hypothetical protein EJC51_00110 [Streptomyces aquilus]AZP22985.1 hypothetical protein EJC51_47435 [Streptomyces aquilus]
MPITPDPTTPAGAAVLDLADLMDDLQERTGQWPGADTVSILEGWLHRFSFAIEENLTSQVTGRAWVLRRWDRHSDDVTLWSDKASALASLAQHVHSAWDDVAGEDGVPLRPPADDRKAVDLFYELRQDIEGYTLYDEDIARCVLAPRNPSLSDAEECAEANSTAVFHAMRGPDDEGLPCMEIAGILVFAYLDADREAVRVSVHLDTTDEQLVRADSTVPMVVEIEDTTVFDNLTPLPAPAQPTGWKARFRRLTRRPAPSGGGKCRQGG